MKFIYKGSKKSNSFVNFISGCAIFVGIGAFIFFLTLIEEAGALTDHIFEIILFTFIVISTLTYIFRKKAKKLDTLLEIKNDVLKVNKELSIPIEQLHLDIYYLNNTFNRYHLWENKGRFAVFSIYEDDLCSYLQEKYPRNSSDFTIENLDRKKSPIYVIYAKKRILSYALDTGKYTISENEKTIINSVPEFYSYDGKYKAVNRKKK